MKIHIGLVALLSAALFVAAALELRQRDHDTKRIQFYQDLLQRSIKNSTDYQTLLKDCQSGLRSAIAERDNYRALLSLTFSNLHHQDELARKLLHN